MGHRVANVYIQPNRYCNYECSYCWPGAHTKVKDFVDAEKLYKTIDDLCKQFNDRDVRRINWGWSGGEATFHPNFLDFQKRILSNDYLYHTFNMTTNVSHNLSWWKKFVKVTEGYFHRQISASLHQEFVNTPAKVRKFKEKCKYLSNNNCSVVVNQVMDIDIFDDQLETMMEITEDIGIHGRPKVNSTLLKQYRKYTGTDGYNSYQMKTMNDYYNDQKIKLHQARIYQQTQEGEEINFLDAEQLKLNDFWENLRDWICTAGYLSVAINGLEIKRGVGACRFQIMGTVGEDFSLDDKPKLCGEAEPCSCTADLKLPKWKEEFDINTFVEKNRDEAKFSKTPWKGEVVRVN
jgi:molybdenum cofactor biosynthesis enzyme MoaA